MGKFMSKLFGSAEKKNTKLRFNTKGSSVLATLLSVCAGVVLLSIVAFLVQISQKVNDINAGKIADGRLSANVSNYNDPAPTFKHYVKAPGFVGNLVGNADTATTLAADPSDCVSNDTFATGIDSYGNLSCSTDGSSLTSVNAITVQGKDVAFFQDASNLNAGTLSDARLSSNVTTKGNTFNGTNQLVQLTATGIMPVLDGSNLTMLNADNIASGTLNDARLSGNVTLEGNTFNGANQLVQLNGTGLLPGLDGANLTNLNGAQVTGVVANATTAVNFTGVLSGNVTGTQGATVVSTVPDVALSSNVTMQGDLFNGISQLVQLDNAGALPTLDGSALTNLNATNIASGTLSDSRLTVNVAKYADLAPTFVNSVTAPSFNGALIGNATTATALFADPTDCLVAGSFANGIAANGNLSCSNNGSQLINLNASNITTGTLNDGLLSANVTLGGNNFNLANGLVQLDNAGALPTLDGSALTNLNASALSLGTVSDARLSANVTKYNDLTPIFVNNVTAPTFTGALIGNATTATALFADPTDCLVAGSFANGIAANGNLSCSNNGSQLINLNASNITTGTLNDGLLSANVTLGGNNFNLANGLVQLDGTGKLPALDGSALTGITVATASALTLDPTDCPVGQYAQLIAANGDLTCNNDGSTLANLNAANITAGILNDARLSSNVTLGGNNFNLANGLVQLDATSKLPAIDGSALTNISTVNFSGLLVGDVTGTQGATVVSNVPNGALSGSVTLKGNAFNGANQLVLLTAGGLLPGLDGSNLTNLTGANVTGAVASATNATHATTADSFTLNPADCTAGQYAQAIAFNGDLTCNNDASALVDINAANISAGTVNDLRLSTNVTLMGNTFNGNDQLVRLSGTGALPAVNGSAVINLTGANVTGTVANATNAVVATTANAFTADPTDCAANTYATTIAASGNLTCASITDLSLSANVTLAGNTFNGANQLVKLTAGGILPVLNASNLTNLTGGNVQGSISGNAANITGTVADANVADNLTINGGTVNDSVIGGAVAAAGTFTNLNATTLTTTGAVNANSLAVTNSATVGTTLTVTGATTLNGAVTINNTLNVTGLSTLASLTVTGATIHNGTTVFNGTVTATAGVNFANATSMRAPVTAVNVTDGVTSCVLSGSGALTFSTNGNFYGCDGAVWHKLNN